MKIFNSLKEANDYTMSFINAIPNNIFINDLITVHFKNGTAMYVFNPENITRIIERLLNEREITGDQRLNRPAPAYPQIINDDMPSLDFNLKLHFSLPQTQINTI